MAENREPVAFDGTAEARTRVTSDLAMRRLRVTGLRRTKSAEGLTEDASPPCRDLRPDTIPAGISMRRESGHPRARCMNAGPLAQESRTPTSIPVTKASVDLMD